MTLIKDASILKSLIFSKYIESNEFLIVEWVHSTLPCDFGLYGRPLNILILFSNK